MIQMNPHYEALVGMDGAEGIARLLDKWEILSSNLSLQPARAPVLLPDLFIDAWGSNLVTNFTELLAAYLLDKGNLMEFYGDVSYFEFLLDYCAPSQPFTEIQRFVDTVTNCAGFRNVFKGLVHIQIDAWVGHQEERHFLNFLDYLAENSDDWLIILSVSSRTEERRKKAEDLEAVVSMFLRIEKLTLRSASAETYLRELSSRLSRYDLRMDGSAEALLLQSIDVLRQNEYFNASYTIGLLCSDIIYEIFSSQHGIPHVLTAEDIRQFASDSTYIRRTVTRLRSGKKIGFALSAD